MQNGPTTIKTATLADFTQASLIVPALREREPVGVIQELSWLLQGALAVEDMLPFYNAALNREFLESTATDFGFAFPHARIAGTDKLLFAMGRSADGFSWGARGAPTVQLVFLLAIPSTMASNYLKVLAAFAKLGEQGHIRRQLLEAADTEHIIKLLATIAVTLPVDQPRPAAQRT
jgi:mannitol/fructose-specific phosphotransferase system IIA component (Ntr-type)